MGRWFAKEIEPDADLSPAEKIAGALAILAPFIGILAVGIIAALTSGCMSENTGSSTVVGEQLALPEITDSSDSVAVRVYESIKGARVWTARDSKVTIRYENAYTNSYLGLVETRDAMRLDVDIEPLAKDFGDTDGSDSSEEVPALPSGSVREPADAPSAAGSQK